MNNETLENKRKRLIYRSEHRGTREMDLLMGSFARRHVPGFDEATLRWYDALLQNNDPDIYNWIIGVDTPPADVAGALFDQLKAHRYG